MPIFDPHDSSAQYETQHKSHHVCYSYNCSNLREPQSEIKWDISSAWFVIGNGKIEGIKKKLRRS